MKLGKSINITIKIKIFTTIFFLFLVTSGTVLNGNSLLSFAQYKNLENIHRTNFDANQISALSIGNTPQTSSEDINDGISINDSYSNSSMTTNDFEFKQDIRNQYSNTNYGISFNISNGWSAAESMNGDKGIIVTMHPGTSDEFFSNLNSPSNNQTIPIIQLIVQDKEDLKEMQKSSQSLTEPALSKQCNELKPNSTTLIANKPFQISTMKCSTSDSTPISGIDFSSTEIISMYKYDSPNTIYILQLLLSSEYSPTREVNSADIVKYQSVMDSITQTLKIKE